MRKVEAAAEQTAHVPPEVVWSLLGDVMVYPQWGPWRKAGYRREGDANGKGAVYCHAWSPFESRQLANRTPEHPEGQPAAAPDTRPG